MKKVVIFYGPRDEFKKIIPNNKARNLTDLVMEIDSDSNTLKLELPNSETKQKEKIKVTNFVVGSDEYTGVKEHVIINFINFLAKIEVENLYLHNPPLSISTQILNLYPDTDVIQHKYKLLSENNIIDIYKAYGDKIKGQNNVCMKLLQALLPLTSGKRTKPVVILFYGDTGLGKTETAQLISDILGEKLFRKQFSMFQNNQFATYLFGGAHYERSFAKDLLDRESNVILLDEFDKANSTFHSAFYQIFDEGIYEDQNYHLELFQSIIICTSNYKSEDDIKSHLGKAIFSRFDAVIKFSSLSVEAKEQITTMQYYKKLAEYDEENQKVIVDSNIYDKLIQYTCQCNNAREISHLIEQTFSRVLLNKLFIELNNHDIT